MEFRPLETTRPPVMARNYAVVAGHYLASLAGVRILEQGGNAIDAGVAAGLVINVVQPDMTNLGGVAPIVMYLARTREVLTISGLGWWPRAASVDWFLSRGHTRFPRGILRSVVPSAADAWLTALERYGRLTFAQVAAPAMELADRGFPVHQFLHDNLEKARADIESMPSTREVYLPSGDVPAVGAVLRQPALAALLRKLVETEAAAAAGGREAAIRAARDRFYRGDIAARLAEFCQEQGGLLTAEDLAEFSVAVEPPVSTTYRGYTVYACGPWCQGPVVPQVLNVLEGFDLGQLGHNSPETLHLIAEALKLGFSDRHHFYGDPRHVDVPIAGLLDKGYAAERRQQIDPRRAWAEMPPPGDPWLYEGRRPSLASDPRRLEAVYGPSEPDTSYVCAVDQEGNAFSATPSDGVTGTPLVPDLGVIISSRGYQSWLEPEHPSAVAPGKRPRLTPSPGLVLKDGDLVMPFGTPGHDVQPQAMVQFLVNLIDFGLAPQEAVEAPRIATYSHPETGDPHVYFPGVVRGESRLGDALDGLAARGHRVERWPARIPTAGAICAILADRQRGVLVGAADPRRMSYAIGW